jgi:hypothetical protein
MTIGSKDELRLCDMNGRFARHFRRSGRHYLSPIAVVAKPELIGSLGR